MRAGSARRDEPATNTGGTRRMLDSVVLDRDLPDHGLCRGDLGTVVDVYEPDGIEVEFVTTSGDTEALLTLHESDVRRAEPNDLISVRKVRRTS